MKIAARVDCSPSEARRLLGRPDLLPLYQMAAVMVERWLMDRIARLDLTVPGSMAQKPRVARPPGQALNPDGAAEPSRHAHRSGPMGRG